MSQFQLVTATCTYIVSRKEVFGGDLKNKISFFSELSCIFIVRRFLKFGNRTSIVKNYFQAARMPTSTINVYCGVCVCTVTHYNYR